MSIAQETSTLVFDHVGIVVGDIDVAVESLRAAIGLTGATERFDDEGLGVSVKFLRDRSGMVFELIAPLGDNSPVKKTLASQQNILNQIAYRTSSLVDGATKLESADHFALNAPSPAKAFGGANVQFFWNPLGFVVELIEALDHAHRFADF